MFKKWFIAIACITALASCKKAPEYYMTLSDKDLDIVAEGGTISFSLSTNTYVRVNNDMADWATLTESGTQGDATLYELNVGENTEFSQRIGTIRFIGDNVTPLKLTLTQKAAVPIGVEPKEISVAAAATSAKFTVLSDKEWRATCDNPAFVLDPESGMGDAAVNLSFPKNESEYDVVANITVKIGNKDFSLKITQARNVVVNLSENGTANCYMVNGTGNYKFDASARGNCVVPESQQGIIDARINPVSVKVLWSTFNTGTAPESDEVLIENLRLADGYAYFSTGTENFQTGNAIIAALDASETILWSWHIWLTEPVSDIIGPYDTWLDRNVGALAACTKANNGNPLTFGFHYQWGRKDPFRCLQSYNADDPQEVATTGTWPAPVLMEEGLGGVVNSIKNPQVFYHVSDSKHNNKDWQWNVQYDDLWGAGADDAKTPTIAKSNKTMFDPCPAGYAIPTSKQWQNMASGFGISKTDIDKTSGFGGVGNDSFWLVYPSGPVYDSGNYTDGSKQPVGTYSWYAGSCTNGVNMLCLRSNTSGFNAGLATSARSAGYTARCVKE